MERPVLMPTQAHDESFAGYTYHLDGELVPALTIELNPGQKVFFEHHILLWKHPNVRIQIKPVKNALKRMIAGMQIFVTEAIGPGQIAFSRDGAGHIFGIQLQQGQSINVREHQFLAATDNVEYGYERVKGFSNIFLGNTGFFIDHFTCQNGNGIVWLHGYGNVFEKVLGPGEQIDIEPGGWLFKDPGVRMETNVQTMSTGLLASMNFVTNRFTGPGRVGLQSMYLTLPQSSGNNN